MWQAVLDMMSRKDHLKDGIFVMPPFLVAYLWRPKGKVYCLVLENGKLITKCKGYSKQLTKEQYLSLLEGNTLELSVTKWTRSLKDSTIVIRPNSPYKINPLLTKRNKILERGKWVNTAPLIIS
jgi:hypothetical protein